MDPLLTGIFHRQGGKRESEWDSEADVSEIKHGWVDDHLGILKEWSQTVAVSRDCAFHQRKGLRSEIQQKEKENLNGGNNDGCVSKQALIGLMTQAQHEPVSRKQQGPEKQRAFLPGP